MKEKQKIEESSFYKNHIQGDFIKSQELKPFEQFLPFDPNLLDIYDSDEPLIDQPLLTHVVISYKEALFPDQYFTTKQLQFFIDKYLKAGNKFQNGRLRIFVAVDPQLNNLILHKDFMWGGEDLTACQQIQLGFLIQRPVLLEQYQITGIFIPLKKEDNWCIILNNRSQPQNFKYFPVSISESLEEETPYTLKSSQSVQDIILESMCLDILFTFLHPNLAASVSIAYSLSENKFRIILTLQKKQDEKGEEKQINTIQKIRLTMQSIRYFNRDLNISIGKVTLNFGDCPFFYDFKATSPTSTELYAYDIANLLFQVMGQVRLEGEELQKLGKRIKQIVDTGDDEALVDKFYVLLSDLQQRQQKDERREIND